MIQQKYHRCGSILVFLIVVGALKLSVVNSYTVNRFGDVLIKNDGETFQCDLIICPKGTVRCQVIKSPDKTDPNFTIHQNICTGRQGEKLLEKTNRDPKKQGESQQLNIVVSDDGNGSSIVSSNFGTANIDREALEQSIQQSVQSTLDQVDLSLQRSLGGLWRGFHYSASN